MSEDVSKKSTEDGTRMSIVVDAVIEGRGVVEEGEEVACGSEVSSDGAIAYKREGLGNDEEIGDGSGRGRLGVGSSTARVEKVRISSTAIITLVTIRLERTLLGCGVVTLSVDGDVELVTIVERGEDRVREKGLVEVTGSNSCSEDGNADTAIGCREVVGAIVLVNIVRDVNGRRMLSEDFLTTATGDDETW